MPREEDIEKPDSFGNLRRPCVKPKNSSSLLTSSSWYLWYQIRTCVLKFRHTKSMLVFQLGTLATTLTSFSVHYYILFSETNPRISEAFKKHHTRSYRSIWCFTNTSYIKRSLLTKQSSRVLIVWISFSGCSKLALSSLDLGQPCWSLIYRLSQAN
jgi:hypothetical protein